MKCRVALGCMAALSLAACGYTPSSLRQSPPHASCVISPAQSRIAWQYAPGVGGLRGRVVNAAGTPLADAVIEIDPGGLRTISDSTGHFRISLPAGTFPVRARAFGYTEANDTISVPGLDGFDAIVVLARPNPGLIGCSS